MSITFEFKDWKGENARVAVERDNARGLSAVWHPFHPFVATVDTDHEPDRLGPALFTDFAGRYLKVIQEAGYGLPDSVDVAGLSRPPLALLDRTDDGARGLEPRWFAFDGNDPRGRLPGSFRVRRVRPSSDDDKPEAQDCTLVLLAGLVRRPAGGSKAFFRLLDGHGLRVVVHCARKERTLTLRATGWASSLSPLDDGAIERLDRLAESFGEPSSPEAFTSSSWPASAGLVERVFEASGLDRTAQAPLEYGVGLRSRSGLGVVVRTRGKQQPGYRIDAELDNDGRIRLRQVSALTAHANGVPPPIEISVFWQDPASQRGPDEWQDSRPSLPSGKLEQFAEAFPFPADPSNPSSVALGHRFFQVCQCAAVGDRECGPETLADPEHSPPEVRSNEFAAVNAYARGHELFELFEDCGLSPDEYFRFARPSLDLHYRSTLSYGAGRSGEVVNAEARLQPLGHAGDRPADGNGKVSVHFARADLQSAPGVSPLGLACDPRWAWHEFGHVLLAAATGELELPFVHSVGDSLAAILCDPDSELAGHSGWRGQTFPWVLTRRRHDRRAADGWTWGGELDRPERTYFSFPDRGRSQYWVEQILSSTLFRLYRALGGDAVTSNRKPDRATRREAARYCAYLIMRAVRLLGPCSVVPASSASQFMAALLDADAGTGRFELGGGAGTRAGGAAIKAIRWAFRRQGLVESGASTAVDLQIDDRLSRLSDQPTGLEQGDPGPWLQVSSKRSDTATVAVIRPDGASSSPGAGPAMREIWVRVTNAGTKPAGAFTTGVRCSAVGTDGAVAAWNSGQWGVVGEEPCESSLEPGESRWMGPFRWTPGDAGDYALLAWVSSADDRACIDPETGLPGATLQSDVRHLAALDDNIALCRVTID